MRFGAAKTNWVHRRAAARRRAHVWLLLAMLGVVLWLMKTLQQPDAAESLGRALAMSDPRAGAADKSRDRERRLPEEIPRANAAGPPAVEMDNEAWAAVKDNSFFLPTERAAWLSLLEAAGDDSARSDASRQAIDVGLAQLTSQPDAYRGRWVRIRGTVVRESIQRATENSMGIDQYHQLIMAPRGGGNLPFVVYALELPPAFPRGDALRQAVVIEGLFFKVWSFADDKGMALAPVVVSKSIAWQPTRVTAAPRPNDEQPSLASGLVIAVMLAVAAVAWTMWQTARPRRTAQTAGAGAGHVDIAAGTSEDATRRRLRELADLESET